VLLWKTGTFLQKRESDVRGRDAEVKGERPTFRGPLDEFGYFLMEARWGFPTDPDTGRELVGWGIPDEVWDELIERLLAQTRERRPRVRAVPLRRTPAFPGRLRHLDDR